LDHIKNKERSTYENEWGIGIHHRLWLLKHIYYITCPERT
jgi:hypothetical protein